MNNDAPELPDYTNWFLTEASTPLADKHFPRQYWFDIAVTAWKHATEERSHNPLQPPSASRGQLLTAYHAMKICGIAEPTAAEFFVRKPAPLENLGKISEAA